MRPATVFLHGERRGGGGGQRQRRVHRFKGGVLGKALRGPASDLEVRVQRGRLGNQRRARAWGAGAHGPLRVGSGCGGGALVDGGGEVAGLSQ